jgi:DNA-binding PadR family transcriptional regulator
MGDQPKLTVQTLRVLKLLLDASTAQRYGLELARDARLPSGTIYPLLGRLERAGWVTSGWEDVEPTIEGRPARRYYTLTHKGRQLAREALADFQLRQASPTGEPSPVLPAPGAAPS